MQIRGAWGDLWGAWGELWGAWDVGCGEASCMGTSRLKRLGEQCGLGSA